jgi:hypothetical protein
MGAIKVAIGTCKLTGANGRFVKSHLIPRALNRLTRTGEKAVEFGLDAPKAKRRPEGWYDQKLVITAGEKLLQKCDDEGIRELRNIGLLSYSTEACGTEVLSSDVSEACHFLVTSQNPTALRRFALSLLWRASHTSIEEFSTYQPHKGDLGYLTELVRTGQVGEANEFMTVITKLVGPRATHNRTPIRESAELISGIKAEYSRFYFNGLVFHIYDRIVPEALEIFLTPGAVGFQNNFLVVTRPFSNSREDENLKLVTHDLFLNDKY